MALSSVGTANTDSQKHDRDDHTATPKGEVCWNFFDLTHTAILQEFVTFRHEPLLGPHVHLQPRPDRLLLQLRGGSRSPKPLQADATRKRLRPRLSPSERSESPGQRTPLESDGSRVSTFLKESLAAQ